jgi:hypothetical protein
MPILKVTLTKPMYWRIDEGDPAHTELGSMKGWSVINPLCYLELNRLGDLFTVKTHQIAMISDKTVLVETDGLLFIIPLSSAIDNSWDDPVVEYMNVFFKHLRHSTKQADIARDITEMSVGTDLFSVPPFIFPISTQKQDRFIKAHIVDTAITSKSIKIADATLFNDTLPVYGTLLLDAILAFMESDYRRSILYAAIAAETMASTILENTYKTFLKSGDPTHTIRLLSLPPKGDIKDPIYDYLSSKTDFVQLIHQLPLYLLRRSLLVENEQLYQNAKKLYATRNKIVHRGDLSNNEQPSSHLPINEIGAREAIECAAGLFEWFGVLEKYIVPKIAFYKCYSIEDS